MKSGKKNYKLRLAAVLLFVMIAVLYVLIYIAPKFSDAFVETYTATYGTLDVDKTVDYLCVRNERVHTADNSGTVDRTVKSGVLRRKGSEIMKVGGTTYRSQIRGIVVYTYDGLEKKFTSEKMMDLKETSLHPKTNDKGELKNPLKKCSKKSVSQGDPVFRIVDNTAWYLVTWVSKEEAKDFVQGRRVTVEFDDEDKSTIQCRIYYVEGSEENSGDSGTDEKAEDSKDKKSEKVKIILSCDRYMKGFTRLRYGEMRIILEQKTGIILDTSSIVEDENGQKGVYVQNKYGKYVFTPISIIAQVGDKTVVENRTYYDSETDKIIATVRDYDSIKKGDGSTDVDQE